MNLCSGDRRKHGDDHEEVAYEGRVCPVCTVQDQLEDARQEREGVASDLKALESELDDANNKLDAAVSELEAYKTDIRAAVRLSREAGVK